MGKLCVQYRYDDERVRSHMILLYYLQMMYNNIVFKIGAENILFYV